MGKVNINDYVDTSKKSRSSQYQGFSSSGLYGIEKTVEYMKACKYNAKYIEYAKENLKGVKNCHVVNNFILCNHESYLKLKECNEIIGARKVWLIDMKAQKTTEPVTVLYEVDNKAGKSGKKAKELLEKYGNEDAKAIEAYKAQMQKSTEKDVILATSK